VSRRYTTRRLDRVAHHHVASPSYAPAVGVSSAAFDRGAMNVITRASDWYTNLTRPRRLVLRIAGALIVVLGVVYVFFMPLRQVPMDVPIAKSSQESERASQHFWRIFWADDDRHLDGVIDELTAALRKHPDDNVLVALLAGAHLWRYQIRGRHGRSAREMKSDLERTYEYGQELTRREPPNDPTSTAPSMMTTAGWQLSVLDEDATRQFHTHIDILENSIVYPAFAGFIQGWLLAAMMQHDDSRYVESQVGYTFMLDTCAGFTLPQDLVFNKLVHTLYGIKSLLEPVCYNNPVAPHSISGTFLSVGDSWLKRGDLAQAKRWYDAIKTAPDYPTWRYKPILEARLADLAGMRDKFRNDTGKLDVAEPAMMFQSSISCGVCHAS